MNEEPISYPDEPGERRPHQPFPRELYFVVAVWVLSALAFWTVATVAVVHRGDWTCILSLSVIAFGFVVAPFRILFGYSESTTPIAAASLLFALITFGLICLAASRESSGFLCFPLLYAIAMIVGSVLSFDCREDYALWLAQRHEEEELSND